MVDYKTLSKHLAAFDDSPERAEIAELELEQKKDRLAIEAAVGVIKTARAELTKLKTRQTDTDQLVEDLREGRDPEPSKEHQEALEMRIEANLEARRKLEREVGDRGLEIIAIQTRLRVRMAEHSKSVVARLDRQVKEALDQLTSYYADIDAIRSGMATNEAVDLERRLALLFKPMTAEWPHTRRRVQEVSPDLVAAMKQAESSIKLVNRKIPVAVPIPGI